MIGAEPKSAPSRDNPASAVSRSPAADAPEALVILGCRVLNGAPSAALERRLRKAVLGISNQPELPVIMSGGRRWQGVSESEAMRRWWEKHQAGTGPVICENHSMTTRENSIFVSRICDENDYHRILLVTCDYHLKRASELFRLRGLSVRGLPAPFERSLWRSAQLLVRECGARALNAWEDRKP